MGEKREAPLQLIQKRREEIMRFLQSLRGVEVVKVDPLWLDTILDDLITVARLLGWRVTERYNRRDGERVITFRRRRTCRELEIPDSEFISVYLLWSIVAMFEKIMEMVNSGKLRYEA